MTAPYGIGGAGRLLHPEGLSYNADITREAGDKITSMIMDDDTKFNPDVVYTVVVSGLMVKTVAKPNFAECEITPTGKRLQEVLLDYVQKHSIISSPELKLHIEGAQPLYTLP